MDIVVFISCTLALTFGCFIQSLVGFGMGVVAAPIILWIDPSLVPTVILVMGIIMSLIVMFQYRKYLCLSDLSFAYLGRLPGTFLASYMLILLTEADMFILLGVFILIAVFLSIYKFNVRATPSTLFIGGLISGVMGTATGIGGPPVALLFQNEEPNKLRANLSAFFVITGLISLAALHYTGHFSVNEFTRVIWLVPIPLLGVYAAYLIRNKVDKKIIKGMILILCSISAVVSLIQGIHLSL